MIYSYWEATSFISHRLAEVIHYPLCIHVIFYPSKKALESLPSPAAPPFKCFPHKEFQRLSMQRSRSLLAFGSLFTLLWQNTYIKQVDNLSKVDNHNASGGAWCLILVSGWERRTFNLPSDGNNVEVIVVAVVVQSSLFPFPFWPEVTVGLDWKNSVDLV